MADNVLINVFRNKRRKIRFVLNQADVASSENKQVQMQFSGRSELNKKTGTITPYDQPSDWMKPKFRPSKGALYVWSVKNTVQ